MIGAAFHRGCAAVQALSSFAFAVASALGAPGQCLAWATLSAGLVLAHWARARQLEGSAS